MGDLGANRSRSVVMRPASSAWATPANSSMSNSSVSSGAGMDSRTSHASEQRTRTAIVTRASRVRGSRAGNRAETAGAVTSVRAGARVAPRTPRSLSLHSTRGTPAASGASEVR